MPTAESFTRRSTRAGAPSSKKRDASATTTAPARPPAKSKSTKRKKAPAKTAKVSKKAKIGGRAGAAGSGAGAKTIGGQQQVIRSSPPRVPTPPQEPTPPPPLRDYRLDLSLIFKKEPLPTCVKTLELNSDEAYLVAADAARQTDNWMKEQVSEEYELQWIQLCALGEGIASSVWWKGSVKLDTYFAGGGEAQWIPAIEKLRQWATPSMAKKELVLKATGILRKKPELPETPTAPTGRNRRGRTGGTATNQQLDAAEDEERRMRESGNPSTELFLKWQCKQNSCRNYSRDLQSLCWRPKGMRDMPEHHHPVDQNAVRSWVS